jgi:glycosyltransferase involved in cell wall biosynthesis
MNSLVSVIIPTHNRSQLLVRAVHSVLSQTYSNLECIIVDDASTDDTQKIIQQFTDPRLIYLRHQVNKHASASRNTGINQAKGDLIAFLDDDDEWLPTKLEKQVHLLESLPREYGMVYCWVDFYRNGEVFAKRHPTYRGFIFDKVLDDQRIGNSSTLLVRKEVIEKIGGFDESLPRGNDGDFIRRVSLNYQVEVVEEVLLKYYTDSVDRITSTWDHQGIQSAIKSQTIKLSKFKEELVKHPSKKASILASVAYYHSLDQNWLISFFYWYRALLKDPQSTVVKSYGKKSLLVFIVKLKTLIKKLIKPI